MVEVKHQTPSLFARWPSRPLSASRTPAAAARSLATTSALGCALALATALGATTALAQSSGRASQLGDPATGARSSTAPAGAPAPAAAPAATPASRPDSDDVTTVPAPPPAPASRPAPRSQDSGAPLADADGATEGEVRTRLRLLDATWSQLALTGGPDIAGAVTALVGSGVQIGLGVLLLELGSTSGADFAPYFFVLGGISAVRTVVVDLVLYPDPRGAAMEYEAMPASDPEGAVERMRYGEEHLRALAERAFIMRMVDGGLNAAAGLAVLPAYLIPRNFELVDLEWLVLIGPAFALVSGIVTMATQSPLEQRWQAYDALRRQTAQRRGTSVRAELALPPAPAVSLSTSVSIDPRGGGMAWVGGRF
jgi:hypothetical protein